MLQPLGHLQDLSALTSCLLSCNNLIIFEMDLGETAQQFRSYWRSKGDRAKHDHKNVCFHRNLEGKQQHNS